MSKQQKQSHVALQVRLIPEMHSQLVAHAESAGRSVSDVVRQLIQDAVEERASKKRSR